MYCIFPRGSDLVEEKSIQELLHGEFVLDSGDGTATARDGAPPVTTPSACTDAEELCIHRQIKPKKCSLVPCSAACAKEKEGVVFPYKKQIKTPRKGPLRKTQPAVSGRAASHSGCGLSRKYKFVYLHVLKSGGSTFKSFLSSALCGPKPCADKKVFEVVDCDYALRQFPDFLTWSFVRNPYSRYYSAFSMANAPNFRIDAFQPIDLEEYLLAPAAQKKNMSSLHLSHFTPQTKFLFSRDNCPAFDVLGHLETLDEDLKYILGLIGSPELWEKYNRYGVGTNQGTNFGSRTKSGNFSLTEVLGRPTVQEAIGKHFADDFESFGFDRSVIPPR